MAGCTQSTSLCEGAGLSGEIQGGPPNNLLPRTGHLYEVDYPAELVRTAVLPSRNIRCDVLLRGRHHVGRAIVCESHALAFASIIVTRRHYRITPNAGQLAMSLMEAAVAAPREFFAPTGVFSGSGALWAKIAKAIHFSTHILNSIICSSSIKRNITLHAGVGCISSH
jgi:hypothetical protein